MAELRSYRGADGRVRSFTVVWRVGGARGAHYDRERFVVRAGRSVKETERDARSFKARVEAHGHRRPPADDVDVPVPAGGLSVALMLEGYIADRAKRVRSDRTPHDYRRDADRWIVPVFGERLAAEVDDDEVQEWVDSIPRAPKTVANLHGVLSGAYKWAIRRRRSTGVTVNPCAGTELPARMRTVRSLRPGEWAILYQTALEVDPAAADVLLFLVGTGWRWSEAAELQVHEVDLDAEPPTVEMTAVTRRGAHGFARVEDAKSSAGVRRVRLSPGPAAMLERRVVGRQLGDYVFTSARGARLDYSGFRKRWAAIVTSAQAAGMRAHPTLHWLRHTHATWLLDVGAPMASVKTRQGHESVTTTVDLYGRGVDDTSVEHLAAFEARVFGGRARLRAVPDS
ncbi:MAG: tyrosine-type recombinase/integrase [Actinomycetes bacterium]